MRLKYCIVIIAILIASYKCDLRLFSDQDIDSIEKNDQIGADGYDRLYLFSDTKDCTKRLTIKEKNDLCEEYCVQNTKDSLILNNTNDNDDLVGTFLSNQENNPVQIDFNRLNLTGALSYYKSFVYSFLTYLRQQGEDDFFEYKIGIKLNKFEILKLEKFSNSINDEEAADVVLDITDILKDMFVNIEPNKEPSMKEKIFEFTQADLIDKTVIQYTLIGILNVLFISFFYLYIRRFGFYITWRKVLALLLFAIFILSVINNHKYLSQKKQILNQQKLKEFVPEECLTQNEGPVKNKNLYSRLFSVVKLQLGYTATSRRCLEYHEALFITSTQNNYVETIVYTVSESVRPIATLFGDFINQFFSALTKDLSFYQYMPLIGLVTTVFVPIAFIIVCFLCLVLFGYEFNFFHLISFKKNQTKTELVGLKKEELLPILNLVKNETDKLSIKTLKPNDNLASVENENLNEALTRSLRNIFDRINDREVQLKAEIENLKTENKKLQFAIEPNQESELEKSEIEEKRCLSIEYGDTTDKSVLDNSLPKTSISIGLSKSVKKNLSKSSKNDNRQTKLNQMSTNHNHEKPLPQTIDDDDDEEDIYVILDEN